MNLKIDNKDYRRLLEYEKDRYLFGSRLHGVNTKDSDYDYVIMLDNKVYDLFDTKAKYLPNIHSFQYDDVENNTQYVLMSERQFYGGLFSGDGNMIADIILFDDRFKKDRKVLTSGYKTIKGYLGLARRDLRLHGRVKKNQLHAIRSLYTAGKLIKDTLPSKDDIQHLHEKYIDMDINVNGLNRYQKYLRGLLNNKLKLGEIYHYPNFTETNSIANKMNYMNNIKNFKY